MGEEAFEECILESDGGSVFVRGGYGRDEVYLGLAMGRGGYDPDVLVTLSEDQTRRLIAALRDMLLPKRRKQRP